MHSLILVLPTVDSDLDASQANNPAGKSSPLDGGSSDPLTAPPSGANGGRLSSVPPSAPSSAGPLPRMTPQPPPGGGVMGGGVVDGQFLPQQSQVFVFSTGLANQAAEAVQRGLCRSIVDFHLDQPATKQFLQVGPWSHS